MCTMFDKLAAEEQRYEQLMARLGTSEVQNDAGEYKSVAADIAGAEELTASGDADMRDLAKEELKSLLARRDAIVSELKILLIPKDPNDEKNVVLEIRAGTGGDEAALFAGELFRMYSKFAERQGW